MIKIWRIIKAFWLAARGHRGQKDKAGVPYIWHLIWVAWIAYGLTGDSEAIVVGLMHDYFENVGFHSSIAKSLNLAHQDSNYTTELRLLTLSYWKHVSTDSYETYIERIADTRDEVMIAVKIADLMHNTKPGRMPRATSKEQENAHIARLHRYTHALEVLTMVRAWRNSMQWRWL